MGLELGEGHFDWIEIWTVGRQEEEPGSPVRQTLPWVPDPSFPGRSQSAGMASRASRKRHREGFDIPSKSRSPGHSTPLLSELGEGAYLETVV